MANLSDVLGLLGPHQPGRFTLFTPAAKLREALFGPNQVGKFEAADVFETVADPVFMGGPLAAALASGLIRRSGGRIANRLVSKLARTQVVPGQEAEGMIGRLALGRRRAPFELNNALAADLAEQTGRRVETLIPEAAEGMRYVGRDASGAQQFAERPSYLQDAIDPSRLFQDTPYGSGIVGQQLTGDVGNMEVPINTALQQQWDPLTWSTVNFMRNRGRGQGVNLGNLDPELLRWQSEIGGGTPTAFLPRAAGATSPSTQVAGRKASPFVLDLRTEAGRAEMARLRAQADERFAEVAQQPLRETTSAVSQTSGQPYQLRAEQEGWVGTAQTGGRQQATSKGQGLLFAPSTVRQTAANQPVTSSTGFPSVTQMIVDAATSEQVSPTVARLRMAMLETDPVKRAKIIMGMLQKSKTPMVNPDTGKVVKKGLPVLVLDSGEQVPVATVRREIEDLAARFTGEKVSEQRQWGTREVLGLYGETQRVPTGESTIVDLYGEPFRLAEEIAEPRVKWKRKKGVKVDDKLRGQEIEMFAASYVGSQRERAELGLQRALKAKGMAAGDMTWDKFARMSREQQDAWVDRVAADFAASKRAYKEAGWREGDIQMSQASEKGQAALEAKSAGGTQKRVAQRQELGPEDIKSSQEGQARRFADKGKRGKKAKARNKKGKIGPSHRQLYYGTTDKEVKAVVRELVDATNARGTEGAISEADEVVLFYETFRAAQAAAGNKDVLAHSPELRKVVELPGWQKAQQFIENFDPYKARRIAAGTHAAEPFYQLSRDTAWMKNPAVPDEIKQRVVQRLERKIGKNAGSVAADLAGSSRPTGAKDLVDDLLAKLRQPKPVKPKKRIKPVSFNTKTSLTKAAMTLASDDVASRFNLAVELAQKSHKAAKVAAATTSDRLKKETLQEVLKEAGVRGIIEDGGRVTVFDPKELFAPHIGFREQPDASAVDWRLLQALMPVSGGANINKAYQGYQDQRQ